MKTIKKYSNRRMYDTEKSKVITLEDIEELIKNNEDFKVIDNSTGIDITTNVLLQTLLKIEQSEDKDSEIKNFILRNLIREYIEKPFSVVKTVTLAGMGLADLTKRDFDRFLAYLVKHGKESQKDGADIIREALEKTASDLRKGADDFAENLSKTLANIFKTPEITKPKKSFSKQENDIDSIEHKEIVVEEIDNNQIENDKDKKIKELEEKIKLLEKKLNKNEENK